MSCKEFRDLILDFLDESLGDVAAFEAHRASCADCAPLLGSMVRNERILFAASVPKAPADLWARIAREIPEGSVVPFTLPRWSGVAAAAAAALVVVTLAFSGARVNEEPRLNVVVVDVESDERGTYSGLMPRYDGMDEATAMAVPDEF